MKQFFSILFLLFLYFLITPFLFILSGVEGLGGTTGGIAFSQTVLDDEEEECEKITNRKAIKLYKKAVKSSDPQGAYVLLKKAIDLEPDYVDAYYKLARMSMGRQSYNKAQDYLLKVVEICPSYNIYAHYYLGDIFYGSGDYDRALEFLREFIKHPDDIKADGHYDRAEQMIDQAGFLSRMYNNPVPFEPRSVEGICTPVDEYLPTISADNEIAFFTRKYEKKVMGDPFAKQVEEFTFSKRVDVKFTRGKPMPPPFNSGQNEGGATLTIDNNHMFFTICKPTTTGYYNCDIYSADYVINTDVLTIADSALVQEQIREFEVKDIQIVYDDEYKWDNIENLGSEVNSLNSWESQPSISSDGKILYFASTRPGGYGGMDIYKTVVDSTGKWGKPINLGPLINTEYNEKSPFIHPDKQTLYFASDGLMGLGGEVNYDIFFAKIGENEQWQKPKNIGYPINTEADDLGLFVSTDGKTAYFASNQTTDKLKGKGGYDLYSFPLYKGARPEKVLFLKGRLRDETGNELTDAKIELKNVRTKEVTKIDVDAETGKYAVAITLKQEDDFIMKVKKEDYAFTSRYISTKDTLFDAPAKIDIEVKPIEIGTAYLLNNINFATNSDDVLTEGSMAILDDFIEFLNEHSTIKVAIHGHTDNSGQEKSNMNLSRNRAKAVNDYLILGGIKNSRLSHRGFGETKPIAGNETQEGRALNRRTEFVIISM